MPSDIPDVDLDALAAGYAHRTPSADAMRRAELAVSHLSPGSWALDVGGGPGAHAAAWAVRGIRAVVLDPGWAMLGLATRRVGVVAIGGTAQRMPFRSGVFGLVYFHLSLHYGDWRRALDEALRVLAPRGTLEIWTLGDRHHGSSFMSRWFPSVEDIDRARFPDPGDILAHLEMRGTDVVLRREDEVRIRPAGEWCAAVEGGFVSTLQLIDRAELAGGLDAFRAAYPDPHEPVEYVIRFDHVTATRRALRSMWTDEGADER